MTQDNVYQKISLPQPTPRSPWTIAILSLVVIIISTIVVGEISIFKNTKQSKTTSTVTPTPASTTKYSSISKSTINCLDTFKDERGVYLYVKDCTSDGECKKMAGNQSGPRPIWAEFKHYQITQDPDDLNKINQDLISHTTQIPTIQNDFWNCKLMFEMYNSRLFNEDQKKMIQDICLSSVNRPSTVNEAQLAGDNYDIATINSVFKEIAQNSLDQINEASSFTNNKLLETSYLASEFVGIYNFTKRETNLKTAEYLFDQAFRKFIKNTNVNYEDSCTLGEASLDLYKATNNQIYLNLTRYIWQNQKIPIVANDPKAYVSDKAICAYFANNLYQNTLDISFKNTKNLILDSLIENNLDLKSKKHFIIGDGCFDQPENNGAFKFSTDNGLIIGLLQDNK